MADVSNPFPFGQCTWWAANECPWVLSCTHLGNALSWAANWRKDGRFVQMTPMVGTIACFQPGSNGADAVFGHVAVVIAVVGAQFTVSEMNGPDGPGRVDDRLCTNNAGVSFLREFAPAPQPTPGDPDVPPMYQRINGSTYLLVGASLLTLGTPADIEYNLGLGSKLMLEKNMTTEYAARFNKLPVL